MNYRWTKLQEVLADLAGTITPEYWSEADALEWAFQAVRKIGSIEQLEPTIKHIKVADYRGDLPEDLQLLFLVAYKMDSSELSADDLTEIEADINHQNDNYYVGFTQGGFNLSDYQPLKLASSPFALDVLCEECENLNASTEHTFTILPDMSIVTSFQAGDVCVAYYRLPEDCGNYLIPDDPDYVDALRSYVLMRIWERRMNTKEEGTAQLYQLYSTRWQTLRRGVAGKLKAPDINQLENLRQTRNRLMPKQERWYKGFANQREEKLKF
jgi:hypothetical protein